MKKLLAAAAIVASVAIASAQETQRTRDIFSITGYVIDTNGNMVLGAEVHARPADRGGLESQSLTNFGKFNLSVNGPGRYLVYCFKDNSGYREIDEALLRLDPEGIPQVVVTKESPKAVTVIRLRPRAAKLTVRLVDSETGRPLEKVQLMLRRELSPNDQFIKPLNAFHKNATIKLLLPSFPLRLSVSAPGYENWSYSDPNSQEPSARLLLAPDEAREITVALRPLRKTQ
jgi:hypothetical protein